MRSGLRGLGAVATVLWASTALAQPAVFGEVRASGPVEVSVDAGPWQPLVGGPIVEGAELRVALGGTASITLPAGDRLDVDEGSSLRLTRANPPSVELGSGRVTVRLRPDSATSLVTPAGIVGLPPDATPDGPVREGTVLVANGEVSVRTWRGDLTIQQPSGALVELDAGEIATFLPGDPAAHVSRADETEDGSGIYVWRVQGNPASDPPLKGSPLWAQLFTGVGLVVSGMFSVLVFM